MFHLRQNLNKIYTKTHQIASIISKFSRGPCPEPPSMYAADTSNIAIVGDFNAAIDTQFDVELQ